MMKFTPLSADALHSFANLIVGFQFPRAWIRKLSLNKRHKLTLYIENVWLRVNDNNVRVVKRPYWCPKKYIYG